MVISRSEVESEWVPVSYAALVLEVSRQRVYQLIKLGVLASIRINDTVLVSDLSVRGRASIMAGKAG